MRFLLELIHHLVDHFRHKSAEEDVGDEGDDRNGDTDGGEDVTNICLAIEVAVVELGELLRVLSAEEGEDKTEIAPKTSERMPKVSDLFA